MILILTGNAFYDVDEFLGCFSFRADACITKPFNPAQLVQLAHSLTASRGDETTPASDR